MKLKDPSLLRSQAYINGAWIDAADGRVFAVNNPADGSLIDVPPTVEPGDSGADAAEDVDVTDESRALGCSNNLDALVRRSALDSSSDASKRDADQ